MSLIARMEFHTEGEPLHAHFTTLAHRLEDTDPRFWLQVTAQMRDALTEYAARVEHSRTVLSARLDELGADDGT